MVNHCNVYIEAQDTQRKLCAVHALNHVVAQGLFTSQRTSDVILPRPDGGRLVNVRAIAAEEDPSRTLQDSGDFSTDTVKQCLQLVGCSCVALYPTDFENSFDAMLRMCLDQPSFLGCIACNDVHYITLRSLGPAKRPDGRAHLRFMDSAQAQTVLWPLAEVKQRLVDSFCNYGTHGNCIVIFVCLTDAAQHDWHIQAAGQ